VQAVLPRARTDMPSIREVSVCQRREDIIYFAK
jgi:hypothetical protein